MGENEIEIVINPFRLFGRNNRFHYNVNVNGNTIGHITDKLNIWISDSIILSEKDLEYILQFIKKKKSENNELVKKSC